MTNSSQTKTSRFIPSTRVALFYSIHKHTNYTYKQIKDVYNKALKENPSRAIYYRRRHAIKVLQGWYSSIKILRPE